MSLSGPIPPQPSDLTSIQLARIAANTAQTRQDVEALGEQFDALGRQVDTLQGSVSAAEIRWEHYGPKLDELHRAVKGQNGEVGLVGQVLELRVRMEERGMLNVEQHEGIVRVTAEKEKRLEERSIDWKWLSMLAFNLLISVGLIWLAARIDQLMH